MTTRLATWLLKTDRLKAEREYLRYSTEHVHALREKPTPDEKVRDVPVDVDDNDLEQAGWGVIFPAAEADSLRTLLSPLLAHREHQAGGLFKEFVYHHDDLPRRFLWHHGVNPGTIDPTQMPYYLLLAGSPESLPFELQYQLAVNHAVGRLTFCNPIDYKFYADNLVRGEEKVFHAPMPCQGKVFAVDNGDTGSKCLCRYLVEPIEQQLQKYRTDFQLEIWRDHQTTCKDLARLLGGEQTPELLLVSSHGLWTPPGSNAQEERQGALVCRTNPSESEMSAAFLACHVPETAQLRGQIAFFFACYGAGTPLVDNFPHEEDVVSSRSAGPLRPEPLALRPFIASLPQVLLARGSKAVIGHVDRGWTLSFAWQRYGEIHPSSGSLIDSLKRLVNGDRLGHALRPLHRRAAALSEPLLDLLERQRYGEDIDEQILGFLWTARNDARNFIVLGDPAVSLGG